MLHDRTVTRSSDSRTGVCEARVPLVLTEGACVCLHMLVSSAEASLHDPTRSHSSSSSSSETPTALSSTCRGTSRVNEPNLIIAIAQLDMGTVMVLSWHGGSETLKLPRMPSPVLVAEYWTRFVVVSATEKVLIFRSRE